MVDEFRSMKSCEGKFSFICADGDTGRLFDVLPSRRLDYLEKHFNSYTLKARKKVKYLVTDMNAPYFSLVKKCFPKAKVIVDRFHIVQHLNRCFNSLRIRIMKSLNQNDPAQAKQYRQLKSLWKLLLKPEDNLDTFDYSTKWRNFDYSQLSEADVLRRLLTISDELKIGYEYFQNLLRCFKDKDREGFYELLNNMSNSIPNEIAQVKKAFKKYESGIKQAMRLPYSNGKIESKNTHIKTLKRNCYGFGNFEITKIRIFLLNGLIKIS